MSENVLTRVVLAARPVGEPTSADFRIETGPVPTPGDGQALLKTLYLSLDPYMRGRMSDAPSYAPPVEIDETMVGATVSRVEASNNPRLKVGDLVLAATGWQSYALTDGRGLEVLPAGIPSPSLALSALGMPGFTAYHGLLKIGNPKPGETVVVGAATGAVGSVVGQVAKIKGARAIGIAGGEDKCRYATEVLGFDLCVDHRAADFVEQLRAAVPDGIDVYFENVGGAVFDAVLPRLNVGARVPVCGLIANYNITELPDGPDRVPQLMGLILTRRLLVQGFIISDHYGPELAEFQRDMTAWSAAGRIRVKEHFIDGLDNAPQGLIDLLAGRNFGKVVVRVAD